MSFGTSTADVETVVAFCRALYRRCRDAGGDYEEISLEVRGLYTVLKHLKYEVEISDSPINDKQSKYSRQLSPLINDCDDTLRELDDLVRDHRALSDSPNEERLRRDSNLDALGLIRVRILSHKSKLTKFLDGVQLHVEGNKKVELKVDKVEEHLDDILDKVDGIAARIQSQTRGSDDREIWKIFRRELIEEGFSDEVLDQHRDVLRAYIREIDQKGLLDEIPSNTLLGLVKAESGLELKHGPPTFSSLDLNTEDSSVKAITTREENMKFPQSIKLDLRKVEPVTSSSRQRRTSDQTRQRPQIPRLMTSTEDDDKAVQYFNANESSDDHSDSSRRRTNNLQLGEVIKTTELIAYSQALQLHPHSPSSFRSTSSAQDYFGDESTSRALPYQPKKQLEYSTSPLQAGAIPIPQPSPRTSSSTFAAPSRTTTFRLAPDQNGNDIPADAKWTKINRRLVSPEVLDQDHRRYEARPEFVAVLGVLSRDEIEVLAERSRILRDARHRKSLPTQAPPPAKPARPIPVPVSSYQRSRNGRVTPSSSESDSESENDKDKRRRRKGREGKGYTGSDIGATVSGYPNPYGQSLPSPVRSPGNNELHLSHSHSSHSSRTSKGHSREKSHDRDRDREESRHRSHRSSTSHSRHGGERHKGDKEKERERYQKSSRWKENLTAAGIGGAAVSLLNVLSEAAEGL